jgi:hypothetical protein
LKIGGYSGGVLNKAEEDLKRTPFLLCISLGASDYDDDDVGILGIMERAVGGSGLTGERQDRDEGNDEVTGWVIECGLFGGMWGGEFGLEGQ